MKRGSLILSALGVLVLFFVTVDSSAYLHVTGAGPETVEGSMRALFLAGVLFVLVAEIFAIVALRKEKKILSSGLFIWCSSLTAVYAVLALFLAAIWSGFWLR